METITDLNQLLDEKTIVSAQESTGISFLPIIIILAIPILIKNFN